MAEQTYIFREGHVYTMEGDKIISKVAEADFGAAPSQGHEIPGETQMPDPPYELRDDLSDSATCHACGTPSSPEDQYCSTCGEPLAGGHGQDDLGGVGGGPVPGDEAGAPQPVPHAQQMQANTITTPNGLTGKILGRVATVWGEEVTVRFENGVIKRLPVGTVKMAHEAAAPVTKDSESLNAVLSKSYQSDKDSLITRRAELVAVKNDAQAAVQGTTDEEAQKLSAVHVAANYEIKEIDEALAHISHEETEAFEPPAPIEGLPEVRQATMNKVDTWLDHTLASMQAEVESTDFEKLMNEAPEAFVAALNDAQLADAGTTRAMAETEIRSFTAGANEEIRDKYENVWLARVEQQRKHRLASRKQEVRKEASTKESAYNGPDEALFL
jgi:hypothetical protein